MGLQRERLTHSLLHTRFHSLFCPFHLLLSRHSSPFLMEEEVRLACWYWRGDFVNREGRKDIHSQMQNENELISSSLLSASTLLCSWNIIASSVSQHTEHRNFDDSGCLLLPSSYLHKHASHKPAGVCSACVRKFNSQKILSSPEYTFDFGNKIYAVFILCVRNIRSILESWW